MTCTEIVYAIRHVLKRLVDGNTVIDRHLIFLINNYRAKMIEAQNAQSLYINRAWIQSFKDERLTIVDSGDVPDFTGMSNFRLGKLTLPDTIHISGNDNSGILEITGSSGWNRFFPISQDRLQLLIEVNDISLRSYTYYIRTGNAIYVYKYFNPVNVNVILGDPFDGYVYRTEFVTKILPDESYIVVSGIVSYYGGTAPGGISIVNTYIAGQTFTGIDGFPAYTGSGRVKYEIQKRQLTVLDSYPVDRAMAQDIILTILTQDFKLERENIADVLNDSADTPEVMKGVLSR